MREFLSNKYVVLTIMAILVFAFTQFIKIPIKRISKLAKNEKARRMINATILMIPFLVGVALDFCYTRYYLHTAFSILNGVAYGMAGISFYNVVERFFHVDNAYNTDEGKAFIEDVRNAVKDSNGNDQDFIKEFYKKVKK